MYLSPEIISIILALIAAASAPGIWALYANRKRTTSETDKLEAETAQIRQHTAGDLIMAYQKRIEELEKLIIELTKRVVVLETELKESRIEIRRLEELNKAYNKKYPKQE